MVLAAAVAFGQAGASGEAEVLAAVAGSPEVEAVLAAAERVEGGELMGSFSKQLNAARISAAIAAAELKTSGEIRVLLWKKGLGKRSVMDEAGKAFQRLKMTETAERNAVLIFLAEEDRAFAILGDSGVHQACGQDFWDSIASELHSLFSEGRPTEALEKAISRTGDLLREHFPRQSHDRNELPDSLSEE